MTTDLSAVILLDLSVRYVRNSTVMPSTIISALGKFESERDTFAVRRMVDGYLKLVYHDGELTKEQVEEVLQLVLEMRRRVKEQLKKLGSMEFYDVNFSYICGKSAE